MQKRLKFFKLLQPSQWLFQLFGISVHVKHRKSITSALLKCYAVSIGIFLVTIITHKLFFGLAIFEKKMAFLFDEFVLVYIPIAHLITIIETLANIPKQALIVQNNNEIIRLLQQCDICYDIKIRLEKSQRKSSWKCFGLCISIVLFRTTAILPFLWAVYWPNLRFELFSWLVVHARIFQVTLDLCQLADQLSALKELLILTEHRIKHLEMATQIYACIRCTNVLINSTYGWSLVAILLQHTMDLVNCSYWIAFNIVETLSGMLNLCILNLKNGQRLN